MKYEVTYLTVYGRITLPPQSYKEALVDKKRLEALNKQPGYLAAGIRINKVAV